ncbi:hypothetical protein NPIL_225171 [Nephila pilipes]|uniref:Uncharacterized protein n=1 Tax=Nephila pilipes TaxID=299642 RepID=A0A8X6TQ90_NEPPI|nr:hypothetical protein NPIL_225171 [Nephila pilipes]
MPERKKKISRVGVRSRQTSSISRYLESLKLELVLMERLETPSIILFVQGLVNEEINFNFKMILFRCETNFGGGGVMEAFGVKSPMVCRKVNR